MIFRSVFIPLLILSFNAVSAPSASENMPASPELIDSIIVAAPVKRVAPKYPMSAARSGNEGWVKMSFVVDTEGNVLDPVIEDSSGIKGFEKESLKAIKKWKFSPAIRDGKAIEQCQNSVQLDFKLSKKSKGARKKFVRQYKEANAALDAGDLVLASTLVKKMADGKIWNGYEDTWFWLLRADLDRALKDDKASLKSLRRATGSKDVSEFVGAAIYLGMLRDKFVLEIKASLYNDALATYARIEQLPNSEEVTQTLDKYATEAKKIVKEQPYFLVNAEISKKGMWWHRLSRNRFSFTDIKGDVDAVELRCANKREKYTVVEGNEWIIPQSWGRCSMMVLGDPTATFNLLEIKQNV